MSKAFISSGSPASLAPSNTFDFVFSNPYQHETEYSPANRLVPRIPEDRAIFVDDNASDRFLTYSRLKEDSLVISRNLRNFDTTHSLDPNCITRIPPTPSCPGNPHLPPVVLIQLPNCLALPPLFLGILASHLCASLISPGFTPTEISWVLQHVRPSLVITAHGCLPNMKKALDEQEDKKWFESVTVLTVDVANDSYPLVSEPSSSTDWKILLDSNTPAKQNALVNSYYPDKRAALVLWSSGTSGRSKGVLLSHHTLNFCITSIWHDADFYQPGEPQRWLGFVPFFHIFGISNIFLIAIPTGTTVYIQSKFTPPTFLEAVKRRQITYLQMAPPVAVLLAKSPALEPYLQKDASGNHGFSTVVGGVSGGAPLGFDTISQVYKRLGFRIRRGYGLTEVSGGATFQMELGMDKLYDKDGDLGKAHWGVQVIIAEPQEDSSVSALPKAVGVDSVGEILVKSPGVLMSYLTHPAMQSTGASPNQQSLTPDGWFRTGDIGKITAHSRLIFTDRIKEIIKVKAFQVAPAELEGILTSDPWVADAGVVGVWDAAEETEWPRAFVSLTEQGTRESGGDINVVAKRLKQLVETHAYRQKWLKGGIVFVDAIPRSPSGKILRRVLKESETTGELVQLYNKAVRQKL